ncbi:putative Elongin-A, partial [Amylocarpus encephaloides]
GAPSLLSLSVKACIRQHRVLTDVGGLEYSRVRVILERIESPEQLHVIETNSPQIASDTAKLWQKYIAKDFPSWRQKNYTPKNPKNWYKVYQKYKREQKEEIARDEEALRAAMNGIKQHKETNVSKLVDPRTTKLPRLPRDPRMIVNNGGVPLKKGGGFVKETPNGLNWTGGSKTKMSTPQGVLQKARREAKEISQMAKLSRPTHQLGALPGVFNQVKEAPAGLANHYRVAAQPATRSVKILSRRPASIVSGSIRGPSLEEREAKLRALTTSAQRGASSTSHSVTMVGSSEDEDDFLAGDDDEVDDLFDEKSHHS